MSNRPIADYALLSDCHTAALVSNGGSVDWLCLPRFDAPSTFGRLLGAGAGHWSIAPTDDGEASRRYLEDTMVLETTFTTAGGVASLVDALAVGADERGHQLGTNSPHLLLRRLTCREGEVDLAIDCVPRPEYGLIRPLMAPADGGLIARGGADRLALSSPVPLEVRDGGASGVVTLEAGQTMAFALHHRSSSEGDARLWSQAEIDQRLEDTIVAWRSWSALHQNYTGPWSDLVGHSGRVLQALTFQPTGAIVAAPTTSLPEEVGGERNWDYRFTWVRDASFTIEALWVAACPDEADKFFSFMATAAAAEVGQEGELQIMFGVGGEHDLFERTLPHLSGWRNSRPVRVGNGAWEQRQLDVYGELLGAAHRLPDQLEGLDAATRGFLVALADTAARRWTETDQGIWEVRGEPRHFVYSKLMCWVALDRAIALADRLEAGERVAGWKRTRDEIAHTILARGWSERAGAFAQSFDSDELDASNLMMPIVGFLPADEPRMVATIDAIAERLTDERGLVYRYRVAQTDDGLSGEEGAFVLCTFWLAQAQALAGQLDRAPATFERAVAYCNDVGLLAEEVDAVSGELLGNFPQAFSHIGLVNAAWAISEVQRGR